MSKQEIRVGQEWTEKAYNQRVMRVDDVVMRHRHGEPTDEVFAARMVLVSGKGRPTTDIQAHILRAGWMLTKEAPDAPLRSIRLTLAADTAATECGSCPLFGDGDDAYFCRAFRKQAEWRLPECRAAEVK